MAKPSKDQQKVLDYLYDVYGFSAKMVSTLTPEKLTKCMVPSDDRGDPLVLPTHVWCEGFIQSLAMDLAAKEVKTEVPVSLAVMTTRAQALKEALEHTDLGQGANMRLGWAKEAREVLTTQTRKETRTFAVTYKDFEEDRMRVWDKIRFGPDPSMAQSMMNEAFDMGKAPTWLQNLARKQWEPVFKEAREFYVHTYVVHKTGEWVHIDGVKESIQKGEDRMGTEATNVRKNALGTGPRAASHFGPRENTVRQRSPEPRRGSTRSVKDERKRSRS